MNIVDRRLNPQGKSLSNRQRFIRRAKKELTEAVRKASGDRKLSDLGNEERVWIKADRLKEPQIRHSGEQGERDYVLPGNKEYVEGDRIKRPQQEGGGRGSEAADDGEGEDAFQFALSQEEFLDIFFDDLELPDLLRKQMKSSDSFTTVRAGHSMTVDPSFSGGVRDNHHVAQHLKQRKFIITTTQGHLYDFAGNSMREKCPPAFTELPRRASR